MCIYIVTCKKPQIENGNFTCPSGDEDPSYGNTCNVVCDSGYTLPGGKTTKTVKCQKDGKWNVKIDSCKGKNSIIILLHKSNEHLLYVKWETSQWPVEIHQTLFHQL